MVNDRLNIANVDLVISKIGRFHPGDLQAIINFSFRSKTFDADSELVIDAIFQEKLFSADVDTTVIKPWYRVSIQFTGISDFKIENVYSGIIHMSEFDIVDLSDRGYDQMRFQIENYEEENIGFFCKSINILSCEEGVGNY